MEPYTVAGVVEGHIAVQAYGKEGFGYDPVFVPEGYEETFAELGTEKKNKISHRALAFARMKAHLALLP